MRNRDFLKNVAIIGTGLDLGLHRKIAELDSGIEIVSLEDVKPPEPIVMQITNSYNMDHNFYSRDEYKPSKRGSNFTPKKKKRKKR